MSYRGGSAAVAMSTCTTCSFEGGPLPLKFSYLHAVNSGAISVESMINQQMMTGAAHYTYTCIPNTGGSAAGRQRGVALAYHGIFMLFVFLSGGKG